MTAPQTTNNALQEKNFRDFSVGSFISMLGRQMLSVAVGWEVYERTHSAFALGLIGLVQLLPVVLLTLPVGHWVDHHDRRKVLIGAQILNALATGGLIGLSIFHGPVEGIYACLFLAGVGRAFHSPANSALLPQVVSTQNLTNAISWNSIFYQGSAILGPALGGLLLAWQRNTTLVYALDCFSSLLFWTVLSGLQVRPIERPKQALSLKSMLSGLEFVAKTRMILAAITLDLFAVLFGGAVALLPVYAKDILHVGPGGLGLLQMAPSLGAITTGFILARNSQFRKAGAWLLWSVVGFGIATIVFGFSTNFWLSFGMLVLTGACDNVSVVIRQGLVMLRTPDEMRGRVSAINYVFIGTSNELGGFESGTVAHYFGPVASVVFGGMATIVTVLGTALLWPELRKLDKLYEPSEAEG